MNQQFKRTGNNISTTVNISFIDAIQGCKVEVKALTRAIMLSIPQGTQPETVMRLKGQGLSVAGNRGDLFVTISVEIPNNISEKQKQLLDEWNK